MKFQPNVLISSVLSVLLPTFSSADISGAEIRINRYTLQKASPTTAQTDLLSAVIETQFPAQVKTVGEAIDFALLRSGYTRLEVSEAEDVMALPLPHSHRVVGPLDLRTTIQTIAGQTLELQENPHERKIWFRKVDSDSSLKSIQSERIVPTTDRIVSSTPTANTTVSEPSQTWKLLPSRTLRANFEDWVRRADWTLEWNSRFDYQITHAATFKGSLREAVETALEHYLDAPLPLKAKFFTGNAVLLIESYQ